MLITELENGEFKQEYVNQEKENIKRIINGKADNKARYAFDRCLEEMYQDKPYGLYKYGYIEDLDGITAKSLYEYYNKMISEGYSQDDISYETGISQGTISGYINGDVVPTVYKLQKIANVLGCTVDDLIYF